MAKRSDRIIDTHSFEFKQTKKLEGSPIAIHLGSDNNLYVLLNNCKIQILSEDMESSNTHEFNDYEPTALTQAH